MISYTLINHGTRWVVTIGNTEFSFFSRTSAVSAISDALAACGVNEREADFLAANATTSNEE